MEINLTEFLKNTRVFSSLSEDAIAKILPKFTTVELKQHQILFYQGEPSDSIYLLVEGKLLASLTTALGDVRRIGYIEPNEMVGELGAIVNEPRSLTIKALKDSVLLKLYGKDYVEICHQYPAVMFSTIHPIINRSNRILQMLSTEKMNKHVVVVPANKKISIAEFTKTIKTYTAKFLNLIIMTDEDEDIKNIDDFETLNRLIHEKIKNKNPSAKVFYFVSAYDTPLAKIAFKKMNMIYIVGTSDSEAKIDHHILDKIESRYLDFYTKPNLILLHPPGTTAPKHTIFWLVQTTFELYHHVRMDNTKDFQRLLRFMRGKAVGLVLGGGGTRGWAHLGVIKALRELKIPIDIIGGTSVGAIVAGAYAIHQSYQAAYKSFYNIVTNSKGTISWFSLTWPVISLFNAKHFTNAQKNEFNDIQIENLWLPYFCVSSNLTANAEEIHKTGLLWEKTRASTSIPGLIPPMIINGAVHVDGGLLNNLPVDVMREYVGKKGKVIAVELTSFMRYRKKYSFPPIFTFKESLLYKLGFSNLKYKFPRFIDTFLRALFMSSSSKTKLNSLAANIFINLDLSQFRLLNVNIKQADRLIEIGYKNTFEQMRGKKKKEEKED